MPSARIAKTVAKLRAGELPAPTPIRKFLAGGLGAACAGCGEIIGRLEKAYYVRVAGGSELFGLHVVCHETWIRFKRRT